MKLSSTLLGAIAVAQADDHPGNFQNIFENNFIVVQFNSKYTPIEIEILKF